MRLSRWIFILYQVLWLNVILPGHTRGAITAPGSDKKAVASCCESHSTPGKGDKKPSERDKQRCAMCFFIAGLTVAPPVVFWQPLVDQIVEIRSAVQNQLATQHVFSTHHGRDPPPK